MISKISFMSDAADIAVTVNWDAIVAPEGFHVTLSRSLRCLQ